MLDVNLSASYEDMVLFSLCNIFLQLSRGILLSPPCSPHGQFPFGLTNATSVYARELWKTIPLPPLTIKFVGMTRYGPASFHDLFFTAKISGSAMMGPTSRGYKHTAQTKLEEQGPLKLTTPLAPQVSYSQTKMT
jgi:hypothetical protein